MGNLNNTKNTTTVPHIQKENPVIAKIRSMGTKFFDLLDGYTESQGKYVDSFFSQRSEKEKMGDFLSICSHREFYEFIEGSPGLRKVFLLKFKERLKYPALNKNTNNYVGEFRIKKMANAGSTHERFKITKEEEDVYEALIENLEF